MRTNFLLLPTLLILVVLGCSKNQEVVESQGNSDVSLSIVLKRDSTDDLRLRLDEQTKLNHRSLRYLEVNNESYLLFLNEINNSIYKYNLEEQINPQRITFDVGGPQGVGKLTGFDVSGEDSLLLLSRYDYKLTVVSDSWSENPSFRSYQLLNGEVDMTPYATTPAHMIKKSNDLYILSVPFFEQGTKSFFDEGNNLQILNLADSSITSRNLYTDTYKENWSIDYGRGSLDYNPITQDFVASFSAEKRLLVFSSPDRISLKNIANGSIKDINEFSGDHNNQLDVSQHLYENYRFLNLIYDRYRNIYFRLVDVPNERALKNGDSEKLAVRTLLIQVLSDEYKLIGEMHLPPYFFYKMVFVGRKGLYIGQPELSSKGIEEDMIRYACFKLSD